MEDGLTIEVAELIDYQIKKHVAADPTSVKLAFLEIAEANDDMRKAYMTGNTDEVKSNAVRIAAYASAIVQSLCI